jgi:hypothetical protein
MDVLTQLWVEVVACCENEHDVEKVGLCSDVRCEAKCEVCVVVVGTRTRGKTFYTTTYL